jgi:hypothetical protein
VHHRLKADIKGIGSRDGYFLKAFTIKYVLFDPENNPKLTFDRYISADFLASNEGWLLDTG